MPSRTNATTADDADRFEAALKAARVPEQLHDGLWDLWVDSPGNAQQMVARFKDTATRTKAAQQRTRAEQGIAQLQAVLGNDEVDVLIGALAQLPPDQLRQLIGQLRTTTSGAGTLTSEEKPQVTRRTKVRAGGMAHLFDEGIKELQQ